jgi:hypothetical protein
MDELDHDLSRLLKNWSAEVSVHKDGRRRLLRAASSIQKGSSWWEDIIYFMPFLDQPCRTVERYSLPKAQTVDWYFLIASNSRISQ